jgi:hypothetical protein
MVVVYYAKDILPADTAVERVVIIVIEPNSTAISLVAIGEGQATLRIGRSIGTTAILKFNPSDARDFVRDQLDCN